MKRLHTFLFLSLTLLSLEVSSQCMLVEKSILERSQESTIIIEGIITNQYCEKDAAQHNIYTIYEIAVTKKFKNTSVPNIVKVAELGGTLGLERDETTQQLHLKNGNAGIFFLKPFNVNFTNASYYQLSMGPQGVITYDPDEHSGSDHFHLYNDIQNEIYSPITQFVGQPYTQVTTLNWNNVTAYHKHEHNHINLQGTNISYQTNGATGGSSNSVSPTGSITSFTPTSLHAGKNDILTINGTGFGATRGTSEVYFENADQPGTYTTPLASQYVSWSNTEIKVKVPSIAGTGNFLVTDGTNSLTSPSQLTITYALLNIDFDINGPSNPSAIDTAYLVRHINNNSIGGYTFRPFTSFSSNTAAKNDLTAVINQWRCEAGINWFIGADSTINVNASDNVNVIRFDIGPELSSGVLGIAVSRYSGCISGGIARWHVREIDIIIDDATNWFYGNSGAPTFAQLDFYSVMLHEVGHAVQLGHVIDNNKVMHYAISSGVQKRVLHPTELDGAKYVVDTLGPIVACSQSPHIKFFCNPAVNLSASGVSVNEGTSTYTITASMAGVSSSSVVVNLNFTGTATSGTDYTAPTSITIPAGSTSQTIAVTITQDNIDEDDETIIVTIGSITNGQLGSTTQATTTIVDDDPPPTISISPANANISENGGSTTFNFTLSAPSSKTITANYTLGGTASSADYTGSSGTITISPGSTSSTVTITAINDNLLENNETVVGTITTATNANIGVSTATITIVDDDSTIIQVLYNGASITNGATINLGNVNAGTSLSAPFSINNAGNQPLTYTSTLSGTNAGLFSLNNTASTNVGANGSKVDSVKFNANCTNLNTPKTAQIVINSNAENASSFTINVIATNVDQTPPVYDTVYLNSLNYTANCSTTVSTPSLNDACDGVIQGTTTDPVSFNANGTYTINWVFKDASNNTTNFAQVVTVTGNITATSSITSEACNGASAVVSVAATGGSGNYLGTGSQNAVTGVNTFTVTDQTTGCSANTSITVAPPFTASINNTNGSSLLCINTAKAFSANTNATPSSLLWSTSAAGGSFNSTSSPSVNYTSTVSGTQTITLTAVRGTCTVNATAPITVGTYSYGLTHNGVAYAGSPNITINVCDNEAQIIDLTGDIATTNFNINGGSAIFPENTYTTIPASTTSLTYPVVINNTFNCPSVPTGTQTITVNHTSTNNGTLALTSSSNNQVVNGQTCTKKPVIENNLIDVRDNSCILYVSIKDNPNASPLDSMEACVYQDPNVVIYGSNTYLSRYFNLTPNNQSGAEVTLYIPHQNFLDFDAYATANAIPLFNANKTVGTVNVQITKVDGGLLPATPSNITTFNATATWNNSLNYWAVTFPVNSFSAFYIGPYSAPLDAAVAELNGKNENNENMLNWSINTNEVIKELYLAKGESSSSLTEKIKLNNNVTTFVDVNLYPISYYQLNALLVSGKQVRSNIIKLENTSAQDNSVVISPNPSKGNINLNFNSSKADKVYIKIYDGIGRLVYSQVAVINIGKHSIVANTSSLATGIYSVQINGVRHNVHHRFIKL